MWWGCRTMSLWSSVWSSDPSCLQLKQEQCLRFVIHMCICHSLYFCRPQCYGRCEMETGVKKYIKLASFMGFTQWSQTWRSGHEAEHWDLRKSVGDLERCWESGYQSLEEKTTVKRLMGVRGGRNRQNRKGGGGKGKHNEAQLHLGSNVILKMAKIRNE